MGDLGRPIWSVLLVLLRSRAALAAENLVLRQQINVLRRTAPKRPQQRRPIDHELLGDARYLFGERHGSELGRFAP
jgi:hypothetical protein